MRFPDQQKADAIKQVFRKYPGGTTISEIASRLKMNRNLVAKYLDHLLISGQLEMKNLGSARIYSVSERVPVSALINYSSDLVLMLDNEQLIIKANDQMFAALGEVREEIIGKKIRDTDNQLLYDLSKLLMNRNRSTVSDETEIISEVRGEKYNFKTRVVLVVYEDGSPGIALILRDITGNHQHVTAIKQYIRERAFLHRKACEFADLEENPRIWEVIGNGIQEMIPGAIISVNAFNPEIHCFLGHHENDIFSKMIGKNMVGFVVNAPDGVDRKRAIHDLTNGRIEKIPGNLHIAFFGIIPKNISEQIEEALSIGEIYSIGLVTQGHLLGSIGIFMKTGEMLKNIDLIEIYARLAALTLMCRIHENGKEKHHSGRSSDCFIL